MVTAALRPASPTRLGIASADRPRMWNTRLIDHRPCRLTLPRGR
jgi:hypothetical protein